MLDTIIVKQAKDAVTLETIFRERYRALVLECGVPAPPMAHAWQRMEDADDFESIQIAALDGDRLLGAIRLQIDTAPEWLRERMPAGTDRLRFGYVSRCFVSVGVRGTGVFRRLCEAAYAIGREQGLRAGFCHCRPELLPLYRRMGWQVVDGEFVHPATGPQFALYKDLDGSHA